MNDPTLAPIVLFVYNRPNHTLRTLQALQANRLANQSFLMVYADGPKPNAIPSDLLKIEQTRHIIAQEKWCKEIHIIESDYNKGLADSIVEGVTQVVNEYGSVIVLEDDIVTSPGFLTYMNDALALYEDQAEVMHVSGFFLPVKGANKLSETFFYNQASCWGWATWARAWKCFDPNAERLLKKVVETNRTYTFNIDDSYPFVDQLKANVEGTLKTWAIKWQASIFLQDGLCLHPRHSMIRNIGFDGTGVHSGSSSVYDAQHISDAIPVRKQALFESSLARQLAKQFYSTKNKRKKSVKRRIGSLLRRFVGE